MVLLGALPAIPIPGTDILNSTTISLTYDAGNDTVLATWVYGAAVNVPIYAVWDGTSWSPNPPIGIPGASSGNPISVYDAGNATVVSLCDDLTYEIWDGTSWSTPAHIPGASVVSGNIFTVYNAGNETVIATWLSPPIAAPTNLTGNQKKNDFGLVFERFNILQWDASSDAAGYFIYRNGIKIASLDASTLKYKDHDQKKGVSTRYAVTAFDSLGNESDPISITIN